MQAQPSPKSFASGHELLGWALEPDAVFARLDAKPTGLDPGEVARRLHGVGPNRLPEKASRSSWAVLISQFKGFLNLLLLAAAVIAWAVGDLKDALMIGAVTVFNAILGFAQEHRAERTLRALKRMVAFRARVRRGGQVSEIAADELVPGDVVVLEAGDRVPADGRLFFGHSLEVDESALTGESVPVRKQARAVLPLITPLAERLNVVFMNSVVTRGRAELVVSATGRSTEMGRIAGMLEATQTIPTPLQVQLDQLAKRLALLAIGVVALISGVEWFRGDSLAQMAIEAVALAVAAVPEGLPAVVTVTLAVGLHRMARQKAIVKRLAAVETLGCTTVICSDKTGTLTMNQMTVRGLWFAGRRYKVSGEGYRSDGDILVDAADTPPPDLVSLLRPLALCNDSKVQDGVLVGDPTEGALVTLVMKARLDVERIRLEFPRSAELPFESERRFMATFHRDGELVRVFVKGAPGALLERSATVVTATGDCALDDGQRRAIEQENDQLAASGLRVLAVAMRELPAGDFDATKDLTHLVGNLAFLGLVGMMDPPRAEAREAIALCKNAGISVKMITGDQRPTAAAIAKALGLEGDAITGADLDRMDDATLASVLPSVAVFARVAPEHKLRIVTALQAQPDIVAMTGDGVNDAAALRKADIGIAMGSGTEVAKEAASMVLTDDNFATIVRAVHEGRTIYDNIVKFVRFQLSTSLGAIVTVFVAPFLGMDSPLGAVQIMWVAMISDGPPAVALGLDTARAGIMSEPPRAPEAGVLTGRRLWGLLFYGAIMAAGTLGILRLFTEEAVPARGPTMAFTTFVLFQVFNVFNVRAEKGTALTRHLVTNFRLWIALGAVVALQVAVVYLAPLQRLFGAAALSFLDWAICVGTASTVFMLEELRKLVARGLRLRASVFGRVLSVGLVCVAACTQQHGPIDQADYFSCDKPSDCMVVPKSCCGTCGAPTRGDAVAIARKKTTAYRADTCGSGVGCPACAPLFIDPTLVATCRASRCALVDWLKHDASACSSDMNCQVRTPDCCPCGGDISPGRLIGVSSTDAYSSLVCDPEQACPECAPIYPPEVTVSCNGKGHCEAHDARLSPGSDGGASELAACEVEGVVYPSGSTGIGDPVSCNTCRCEDGALTSCTKINCPETCPDGSAYGTSCVSCGPTDNCNVVRIGCLQHCDKSADCSNGESCIENICATRCG